MRDEKSNPKKCEVPSIIQSGSLFFLCSLWDLCGSILFQGTSPMYWVRLIVDILLVAGIYWLSTKSDPHPTTYPTQPIKIVVPFSQGGESDTFARILQKGIDDNDLLPVHLEIINRNGASGTLGSRHVKEAKADGYTVLLLHDALFMAKYAGQANYGPEAFEPIAATGRVGLLVAVSEKSRFKNLPQLMEEISEHPNTVVFGANLGAPVHFAALQLEKKHPGAEFRFTQSGSGSDRLIQLMGDQIDVTVFSIGEFVRFRSEGIRALAYFGDERHPGIPDVPTAKEQGYPLEISNMQFWWCPKGTPQKRIQYFADVLKKALQTDIVKERLAEVHCDPDFIKGKDLQQHIQKRTEALEDVSLRPTTPLPDIPFLLLATVLGMAAVLGVLTWRNSLKKPEEAVSTSSSLVSGKRQLVLICLGMAVVYVLLLSYQILSFSPATFLFVLGMGFVLTKFRLSTFPFLEILALALGLGLTFLLTQVFVVDLP